MRGVSLHGEVGGLRKYGEKVKSLDRLRQMRREGLTALEAQAFPHRRVRRLLVPE